jgi:flagellar biosynthesis/type III secretory pathway protein FliH
MYSKVGNLITELQKDLVKMAGVVYREEIEELLEKFENKLEDLIEDIEQDAKSIGEDDGYDRGLEEGYNNCEEEYNNRIYIEPENLLAQMEAERFIETFKKRWL